MHVNENPEIRKLRRQLQKTEEAYQAALSAARLGLTDTDRLQRVAKAQRLHDEANGWVHMTPPPGAYC